ncbi:uroporphyrinogen-III C-methyltransferase [Janibacter melonis]|uniref:uroporphyrinogen-III C-methyltransferase n=1 Tax=Janibacter melonis TaxID=262209 RepID=UPI0020433F38|nr:uroporphyrinogen-III C-methyltransferase [Janibacter melonis]MCM3554500.1 uroporphyrinogen-III C-methyltransferase [Janibacter melonis]
MIAGGYRLGLDLTDRLVLVVGGGPAAVREAEGCLVAGARVLLLAPEVDPGLAGRAGLTWRAAPFEPADLSGPDRVWLVHAATGDPATDGAVARAAEEAGVWCVRAEHQPRAARGHGDGRVGRVALVGGGPGAPDLITVRGARLLGQADVVVSDRLGPVDLLAELPAHVEVVDVGKHRDRHPVPQDRINEILVDRARRGLDVVRLKGGDPFVLGRGGEEALHCAAHGIAVEVVPGITSAISVPAAVGIPVTHRGITTSFVVASAHEGAGPSLDGLRDAPQDATLVLLMGVTALGRTAADLVAAGRAPGTPVAIVERGWMPGQRVTRTTLSRAAVDAQAEGVRAPAVVVVGEVVTVPEQAARLLAGSTA